MPKIFHISEEICLYVTFSDYRWQTCVCMPRKLLACVDNTASVVCVTLCSSNPYQYESDEFFFYKGCGPTNCHCILLAHTAVFQIRGQLLTKSIVLPLPGMLLTGAELQDFVFLLLC